MQSERTTEKLNSLLISFEYLIDQELFALSRDLSPEYDSLWLGALFQFLRDFRAYQSTL